ncbi:MAG: ornithine cyclodeaminase family protein [Methanomicrobia archaeon]|nr:ornithine cyclodeaminase family protein [Methanomicrobia archaeon]
MIVLKGEDVRMALPMDACIAAMKRAFASFSDGRAQVPLRAKVVIPAHEGESLFMPAFVDDREGEALAVKTVSVFPRNAQQGLPTLHAAVLVLEASTGRPTGLLEGGTLTAIRTGAASGAATDLLARPDSVVAAIFGAGVQARTQLEAICTVRAIQTVWVYDRIQERVEAFISEMAGTGPIPRDLRAAASPQQAVADADVICTATTSVTPVFADADLKSGVHINGIGSYTPDMQEVPAETVSRALVVVDSREAALAEAGDLIQPIRQGTISEEHLHAELGELVLGRKQGRTRSEQVTFFKSVGVAVQDAVAARLAVQNAEVQGLGQRVDW